MSTRGTIDAFGSLHASKPNALSAAVTTVDTIIVARNSVGFVSSSPSTCIGSQSSVPTGFPSRFYRSFETDG